MPEKQILHYIKNEADSDLIYLVAVACLEKLVKMKRPSVIKAIVDAGTASMLKILNEKE